MGPMISTILATVVTHTFYMERVAHRVVSVRTGWKWFVCTSNGISNSIFVGGVLLEVLCLMRGVSCYDVVGGYYCVHNGGFLWLLDGLKSRGCAFFMRGFRFFLFDPPLWLVHTGVLGVTRDYVNLIG